MKKRLLVIGDRMPFPARRDGLTIRYAPIIRYLSLNSHITFVYISDIEPSDLAMSEFKNLGIDLIQIPESGNKSGKMVEKLLWGFKYLNPLSMPNFHYRYNSVEISRLVSERLQDLEFDASIFIWQKHLNEFESMLDGVKVKRTVIDFVDSPTLISQRRLPDGFLSSVYKRIEVFKTRNWEKRLVDRHDCSIYIAEEDKQACDPGEALLQKQFVVKNGVYTDDLEEAKSGEVFKSFDLGFVGQMSYKPNIDAALYLYQKIFLPLQENNPSLTLGIIGRAPSEEIKHLARSNKNVTVTGEVESITSCIKSVRVAVFPMVSGGGLQNKVIDSMLCQTPVVTTSIGNEGINAVHEKHLLVFDNVEDIIEGINSLLHNSGKRAELSKNGLDFVLQKFGWEGILKNYQSIIYGSDYS